MCQVVERWVVVGGLQQGVGLIAFGQPAALPVLLRWLEALTPVMAAPEGQVSWEMC